MNARNAIEAAAEGTGLYSVQEAALYSGLHANTIRRWFFQGENPVFRKPGAALEGGSKLLTFTDFVETLYVRELRNRFHISFPVIRAAVETARDLLQVASPFAHPQYRTVVSGNSIHLYHVDRPELMTSLTHDRGQMSSRVILEDFIDSLEFDEDEVAKLWVAYKGQGEERIVAARDYNFGIPMLEKSQYTAETLWRAAGIEGGVKEAAEAYGVAESAVQLALDYFKTLRRAA